MVKKKLFLALLAVGLLLLAVACTPQGQQSAQGGRAVFTMADVAANMSGVTSVKVTIDSVRVLSENGTWTEVSANQQTYDLLKLKASGNQVLLADYNLTPGVYQQVRLDISKIIVTDASGDHTAKLPSRVLRLVGKLTINENSVSTVKFDFIADESLHTTGDGTYIFAPVIHLETRQNANADTESKDDVRISGGKVDTDTKQSMDLDGNFGEGLKIRKDSRLSVKGEKVTEE
jgi:hypothetical protein